MGKLRKLLRVSDLRDEDLEDILSLAYRYLNGYGNSGLLNGKVVANFFLENSTRTLLGFEIAEKALGAISITLNISTSSMNKGESVLDTLSTLSAMGADLVVIRSGFTGFIDNMAAAMGDCCIINAGDGSHEHPTQAITDYATIRFLRDKKDIKGLKVTICGDVLHSRVARSNINLLSRYGACIRVVVPPTSTPILQGVESVTHDLREGIRGADVIMVLRIQKERMESSEFISEQEYSRFYILDREKLSFAKDDVIILHPGPINRDVEISSEVADENSAILLQVRMGVAIRKAILHYMLG